MCILVVEGVDRAVREYTRVPAQVRGERRVTVVPAVPGRRAGDIRQARQFLRIRVEVGAVRDDQPLVGRNDLSDPAGI
jgi:hypothetical protein